MPADDSPLKRMTKLPVARRADRLTAVPSANLVLPDQDLFLIVGALNDGNAVRPDAVS